MKNASQIQKSASRDPPDPEAKKKDTKQRDNAAKKATKTTKQQRRQRQKINKDCKDDDTTDMSNQPVYQLINASIIPSDNQSSNFIIAQAINQQTINVIRYSLSKINKGSL